MWFQATASRWGNILGKQWAPEITLLSLLLRISSHLSPVSDFMQVENRNNNEQNLTFSVTDLKTRNLFNKMCLHCSLLGSRDPSFHLAPIFMKEMQTILYCLYPQSWNQSNVLFQINHICVSCRFCSYNISEWIQLYWQN